MFLIIYISDPSASIFTSVAFADFFDVLLWLSVFLLRYHHKWRNSHPCVCFFLHMVVEIISGRTPASELPGTFAFRLGVVLLFTPFIFFEGRGTEVAHNCNWLQNMHMGYPESLLERFLKARDEDVTKTAKMVSII